MSLHELVGPRQPYACLLVLGLSHAYGVRTLQLLPLAVAGLSVATGSSWSERWNLELLQCGQCLLLDLAAFIVCVA